MPHSSPPPSEHVPDEMPQPSPARTEQVHHKMPQSSQQAQPIHEQRVPPEEGDAQEDEDVPEWELRKKIPIHIRPVYVPIKDVSSVSKWYSHDQFKPENQVKKVPSRGSEEAVSSKLHQIAKQYPNVDAIEWSKDCPKKYERGKPFLPNRDIQRLPLGMRRFHDWYLRVLPTSIDIIQACVPTGTFGSPAGKIVFDFNDMHTCFHLGEMEMNLIRTWCL